MATLTLSLASCTAYLCGIHVIQHALCLALSPSVHHRSTPSMSEGSVFQRKSDGKWCGKWKDANGKWRYLYRKSRGEAKQALREALRDRDDNIVPADKLTLSHAMDVWLEGMKDSVSH